ncbi:MoxR family ATPase [Fulvimarina endophytica]|uniref:MoxR family ATPase n=1 Tax=Fulvimarina endophytica TaxID=2293836 RepID=A0A371X2T0_9HYPH|nr:MoxR family ATPase [Fulvimarina endophytica]RFC63519.1 MoxR family ATPase [Fulvimarina endophytica]
MLDRLDSDLKDWRSRALAFERRIGEVVLGQADAIRLLTIAALCRGHVLLEGDVGVGKTTLLRTVARALGGPYERIEGTIDLMPNDMLYSAYIAEDGRPRIDPGPAIAHGEDLAVFFFNEINRARPQVHSLLLRMMAERSVSAFRKELRFPHLQVFADRNKVERDETFELPAAARDRFMMEIRIETPADPDVRRRLAFDPVFHDADRLIDRIDEAVLPYDRLNGVAAAIQTGVRVSPAIETYLLGLWDALSDPARAGIAIEDVDISRLIVGGASPRGISALVRAARARAWLEGRDSLVPDDIRAIFAPVMGHRIFFSPIYEMRRDQIAPKLHAALFDAVPVPV